MGYISFSTGVVAMYLAVLVLNCRRILFIVLKQVTHCPYHIEDLFYHIENLVTAASRGSWRDLTTSTCFLP